MVELFGSVESFEHGRPGTRRLCRACDRAIARGERWRSPTGGSLLAHPIRSIRGKDDATIGSLRHLTRALDKLAHSGQLKGTKKLYLTEYGYLATGRRGLSERKRASYLKQGLRIARKNRRVKEVVQYLLVQPNNGSPFTTGIISASGVATPSFAVLRAAA